MALNTITHTLKPFRNVYYDIYIDVFYILVVKIHELVTTVSNIHVHIVTVELAFNKKNSDIVNCWSLQT